MKPCQLVFQPISQKEIFLWKKNDWKMKPHFTVIGILKERTVFKNFKSFPKVDKCYFYDPEKGVYKEYTSNELIVILNQLFERASLVCSSLTPMSTQEEMNSILPLFRIYIKIIMIN